MGCNQKQLYLLSHYSNETCSVGRRFSSDPGGDSCRPKVFCPLWVIKSPQPLQVTHTHSPCEQQEPPGPCHRLSFCGVYSERRSLSAQGLATDLSDFRRRSYVRHPPSCSACCQSRSSGSQRGRRRQGLAGRTLLSGDAGG